jgi:predicted  nucleic acid-binding Zn-ribbon protein
MSRRDNDQIGQVPRMAPAHDEIASFQRSKGKGALASSLGDVPDVGGGGTSMGVKSVLAVVVVLLLATSAGAGFLFQKLQKAEKAISQYEIRIGDLERRLSVTDESMSESSVAMKVKVRELDTEIRKLWDNVWKKSKQRFAQYDKKFTTIEQGVKRNESFSVTAKQQLAQNNKVVSNLSVQLKDVEQMKSSLAANQQKLSQQEDNLESTSDKANRLGTDVNKIDRRLKSTEEWVESINGFRRQVNRDINSLKQSVGKLESPPSTSARTPAPAPAGPGG